jgi:hypothetical protein
MALRTCEDCGREISVSAASCPHCGRPSFARCPHCGASALEMKKGLQGAAEIMIGLVLFVFGIVPGLIYYFVRERMPYCTACRRRAPQRSIVGVVPTDEMRCRNCRAKVPLGRTNCPFLRHGARMTSSAQPRA